MRKAIFVMIGLVIALLQFTAAETNYGELDANEWGKENLKQAGDLSKYQNAWQAINQKHGLEVDLTNGATYADEKLTNGDVTLDLTAPGLSGAKIVALNGGGFSITKGTAENFEYSGNKIDFGKSTGTVEVKTNGEIILPNGATLKDEAGNIITALRDGLTVKKEESTTIITGVGKVETPAGVGYVGIKEKEGIIVLEGETLVPDLTMCNSDRCMREEPSNNYVWAHKKGNYKSGELEMSQSKPVEFDEEMRKTLIELAGGEDMALLKRTEALTADFKPYFSPDVAQKLALGIHGESPQFTNIDGNRGYLVNRGGRLVPHVVGETDTPLRSAPEEGDSSAAQSGDTENHYYSSEMGPGTGTGMDIKPLGGRLTVINLRNLAKGKAPAFIFEKDFGGAVVSIKYDQNIQGMSMGLDLKNLLGKS